MEEISELEKMQMEAFNAHLKSLGYPPMNAEQEQWFLADWRKFWNRPMAHLEIQAAATRR